MAKQQLLIKTRIHFTILIFFFDKFCLLFHPIVFNLNSLFCVHVCVCVFVFLCVFCFFVCVCVGLFSVSLNNQIMSILPFLIQSIHGLDTQNGQGWITIVYAVSLFFQVILIHVAIPLDQDIYLF